MPASGEVVEGTDFSVLCIAMGSPPPMVTLYVSGHPIRSEVTRHMVTTLNNATRYMGTFAGFMIPFAACSSFLLRWFIDEVSMSFALLTSMLLRFYYIFLTVSLSDPAKFG